jgi:NAD(P)-dependent dehydrogenase (short-subunit alcohol dehydrogenase family)
MDGYSDSILTQIGLAPGELAGQTAVITGAGRGIGKEAARALAWLGAQVVLAELSPEGQAAADELVAAGYRALYLHTDVSQEADIARLARATEATFGPATILVNNAILSPTAAVLEMDVETWDRVLAVNLRGAFLICKAFLPGMLAQGRGTIINMTSLDAMPYLSAYITSKQGLSAFSRSLAGEVGEGGVRVIALAPGFVDTPGLRGTANGLAPHSGMTPDEFVKLSLHPAYAGAMPVEHAGAATAYLVARLAEDYQGEQVTGYTILERAGLIDSAEEYAPQITPSLSPQTRRGGKQLAAPGRALTAARELPGMLEATEVEFNRLPIFVRPMARQGLKSKTRYSLTEWKRLAERLVTDLERAAGGNEGALDRLQDDRETLRLALQKLSAYYADTPAETARFTKDAELLAEVQRIADERVATIAELIAALD